MVVVVVLVCGLRLRCADRRWRIGIVNNKLNLELGFALFMFMIIKKVNNKPKFKLEFAMFMSIRQCT